MESMPSYQWGHTTFFLADFCRNHGFWLEKRNRIEADHTTASCVLRMKPCKVSALCARTCRQLILRAAQNFCPNIILLGPKNNYHPKKWCVLVRRCLCGSVVSAYPFAFQTAEIGRPQRSIPENPLRSSKLCGGERGRRTQLNSN